MCSVHYGGSEECAQRRQQHKRTFAKLRKNRHDTIDDASRSAMTVIDCRGKARFVWKMRLVNADASWLKTQCYNTRFNLDFINVDRGDFRPAKWPWTTWVTLDHPFNGLPGDLLKFEIQMWHLENILLSRTIYIFWPIWKFFLIRTICNSFLQQWSKITVGGPVSLVYSIYLLLGRNPYKIYLVMHIFIIYILTMKFLLKTMSNWNKINYWKVETYEKM